MAGDSGPPFKVLFGSSRRVVKKRSGGSSDDGHSGSTLSGSKRSVKDRLGTGVSDFDDGNHHKYKRKKGENDQAGWNKNVSNDAHLEKRDLRHTILQKKVDLRDKLSRKKNLVSANGSKNHSSEATDGRRKGVSYSRGSHSGGTQSMVENKMYDGERKTMREPRDTYTSERQSRQEGRDSYVSERQSRQEVRDSYVSERQSRQEVRDSYVSERQSRQELRDSYVSERQSMPTIVSAYDHERRSVLDSRDGYDRGKQLVVEPGEAYDRGIQGILGSVSSSRAASNATALGPVRSPYPSWPLNSSLRQRSPDRILSSTPMTFSPGRNAHGMERSSMFRAYDDVKPSLHRNYDFPSPPRASGSSTFLTQPGLRPAPSLPAQPVPLLAQYPPPSGLAQNILYPGPTVDGFLETLGLEKYAIHFKAEEVDFNTLRQMTDTDLKELSIPMGPRKKIIQALASLTPRLRRQL